MYGEIQQVYPHPTAVVFARPHLVYFRVFHLRQHAAILVPNRHCTYATTLSPGGLLIHVLRSVLSRRDTCPVVGGSLGMPLQQTWRAQKNPFLESLTYA